MTKKPSKRVKYLTPICVVCGNPWMFDEVAGCKDCCFMVCASCVPRHFCQLLQDYLNQRPDQFRFPPIQYLGGHVLNDALQPSDVRRLGAKQP